MGSLGDIIVVVLSHVSFIFLLHLKRDENLRNLLTLMEAVVIRQHKKLHSEALRSESVLILL